MAKADETGIETFIPWDALLALFRPFIEVRRGFENTTVAERELLATWGESAIMTSGVSPMVLDIILAGLLPVPELEKTADLQRFAQLAQRELWVDVVDGALVFIPARDFLRSRPDVLAELREDGCEECSKPECILHPIHYQDENDIQVELPDHLKDALRKLTNEE